MQVLSHASNSLSIARFLSAPLLGIFQLYENGISPKWICTTRSWLRSLRVLPFGVQQLFRVHTKLSEGNSGTGSSDAKKYYTRFCTSPIAELHFSVYSFRWHSYYMQCAFTVLIRVIFFFSRRRRGLPVFRMQIFHINPGADVEMRHTHALKETKRIRHPMWWKSVQKSQVRQHCK